MAPFLVSRQVWRAGLSPVAELPPAFLAPILLRPLNKSGVQCLQFSSSSGRFQRNKQRGVSAIHRTGTRGPLSVSKYPLPKPSDPASREARPSNPNHGLWGFFPPDRVALPTPEDEGAFGRPWSHQELRRKDWNDLHCLWWTCVKERNRLATSEFERKRLAAGYGDWENRERDKTVYQTQAAIKAVLRERWYAWEHARELFENGYKPPQEELTEEEPTQSSN